MKAKQRLLFSIVFLPRSCVNSVSPHVNSAVQIGKYNILSANKITITPIFTRIIFRQSAQHNRSCSAFSLSFVIRRYSRGNSPGPFTVPIRESFVVIILNFEKVFAESIAHQLLAKNAENVFRN